MAKIPDTKKAALKRLNFASFGAKAGLKSRYKLLKFNNFKLERK